MSPRDVVLAWHDALNAGDVARLAALSADDVEVGGPRGAGRGVDLLSDWVARAGIQLVASQLMDAGSTVVVEQRARWRGPDGALTEPQVVASVFHVSAEGRVSSVLRYRDLAEALAAAGLAESGTDPRRD